MYKFIIYCNFINICIKLLDNLELFKVKKIKFILVNILIMLLIFGVCCFLDFSILLVRVIRVCFIWIWLNGYYWLRFWVLNSWRVISIFCMTLRLNVMVRIICGLVEIFFKSFVGICLRVDIIVGEEKR